MRLDDELIDFLARPLMCIIAAADNERRPATGRGVGVRVLDDRETIDVIFSGWQWPKLEACVRQTGRLAATFVSPSDYRTFQIKGRAAMREFGAAELAIADCFIASATDELSALGVPLPSIAQWLTARDAKVTRIDIGEIYVQTPGPRAGMLAAADPE